MVNFEETFVSEMNATELKNRVPTERLILDVNAPGRIQKSITVNG